MPSETSMLIFVIVLLVVLLSRKVPEMLRAIGQDSEGMRRQTDEMLARRVQEVLNDPNVRVKRMDPWWSSAALVFLMALGLLILSIIARSS